jgi:recombination protein RecT
MSTQITPFQGVQNLIAEQRDMFMPVLTDQSMSWEKEKQFALQVLNKPDNRNKNELCFAGKTALNNPASLQNAIINVAACGITLNPAAKLAYLVPRDGAICLDISYMGLLHIAQQSGSILWGQCKLVYSNDSYRNMGLDKAPEHIANTFGDRGNIIGGYCTIKTPDGDYLTEEMSIKDIEKVKATSKAANGPWKTFYEEMARKTIVKRASKYWPKADRLDQAIDYLNTDAGEGLTDDGQPQPELIIDAEQRIVELANGMGKKDSDLFEWLSKSFKREIQCFDDMAQDEIQFICRKLEGKK